MSQCPDNVIEPVVDKVIEPVVDKVIEPVIDKVIEPVVKVFKIVPLKKIQKKIIEPVSTPLELQMEEMNQMMKPLLEIAEKAKKEREAEEERKATAMRKAKEERKAEKLREAEAACKAEELRRAKFHAKDIAFLLHCGIQVVTPYAEMDKSLKLLIDQYILERIEYEKANRRRIETQERIEYEKTRGFQRSTPASISYLELLLNEVMSKFSEKERKIREIESQICKIEHQNSEKRHQIAWERKQRELAEHALRQEEARKRSAARIQAGEFSVWMKYQNEHRMGTPIELFLKGNYVWASDRTPITIDGKVCVGPRLGSYIGYNFEAVHFSLCGISPNCIIFGGVKHDGSNEPKLY